ncbi:MAG: hypothetical protein CFE43_15075 [Burkholderiales bacterium PBB3]|nr:MAG: hypothetical protein CFE43_15075 [Burkholderiales bacterium PBB3]
MDSAGAALVFIAALVYLFGLSSPYAPTNGDEMVYIHIARMTAESGHWLPLQSEIVDTRNTKPPLLFWQAMVAGDWGQRWDLWALRLPSVLYTFATTALLAFFTFKFSGRVKTACTAAAVYLLFFSTFRYGRVYLTSAPETFWLALPMWWVLWTRLREGDRSRSASTDLHWLAYTGFGVAFGLGAAYKSFALIAPAAAGLWSAILLSAPKFQWQSTWRTTVGVGWSTVLGLGIFALWFALDPDPAAVWQEFIVAENAGKMSAGQGYWHAALFGAYPMWTQLLAYPENAGLLFFVAIGLILALLLPAFKKSRYAQLAPHQWILLAWLVVWLLVFTLPSQRSARYVIPAMPALAIVTALLWDRVNLAWFWITLVIAAPILLMLARIGWVMGSLEIASPSQVAITLLAACAGFISVIVGFLRKHWCRQATLWCVLAVYGTFGAMVGPLNAPSDDYLSAARTELPGRRVAVPNGFTGQFERYHFVLPTANITPYDAEGRNTGAFQPHLPPAERLDYLLKSFDAVVWLQDDLTQVSPSCLPHCKLLGSRWHVKSRHKSGEITLANLWYPDQWLFRREWLLSSN